MKHTLKERVLCLAGLFQAASLVKRTALHGAQYNDAVETSLYSLFQQTPDTVEAIYRDASHLRPGLETLVQQMGNQATRRDVEITRYVISLLFLQKKLMKNPEMLQTLNNGMDVIEARLQHFSLTHENTIAGLADLYQQTISQLQPRILVSGEQAVLGNNVNAELIRALLLAGIRSAIAWHQCGGSRLQLIFKRRSLLQEAQTTLDNLPAIDTIV